jgi:hypothetical protein
MCCLLKKLTDFFFFIIIVITINDGYSSIKNIFIVEGGVISININEKTVQKNIITFIRFQQKMDLQLKPTFLGQRLYVQENQEF